MANSHLHWLSNTQTQTWVFLARGWNPHFSTTEDRTISGVVSGVKPLFITSESVQLRRAISNRTASFFR